MVSLVGIFRSSILLVFSSLLFFGSIQPAYACQAADDCICGSNNTDQPGSENWPISQACEPNCVGSCTGYATYNLSGPDCQFAGNDGLRVRCVVTNNYYCSAPAFPPIPSNCNANLISSSCAFVAIENCGNCRRVSPSGQTWEFPCQPS